MAGESTYSLVSALLPTIWEAALDYAQHSFVMPSLVTQFTNMSGMVARNVSEYVETGVTDNLGELVDLTPTEYDRNSLTSLTPKEIGKQYYITDRRVESDVENVMVDAALDLGYTIGRKVETDLLSTFASFTGGTFGANGSDFSMAHLYNGRAVLEAAAVPGPYYAVIHPYQYLDIFNSFTALASPAPLDIRNEVQRSYYVTQVGDMRLIVSSLVPITAVQNEIQTITHEDGVDGGTFTLEFAGQITSALAWNISAANLELALEALVNIGTDNVTVTGSAGGPYTITFTGALAGVNVPTLVAVSSLTDGGVAEGTTVAVTQHGINYARGGIFTRDAIAWDLRRGFRIEPDRDPSARATELNATMIYAAAVWRAARGVQLRSDASKPIS